MKMSLWIIVWSISITNLVNERKVMSKECKKNVIMNVRINSDLKNESGVVLKKLGLDHSKAIRLLIDYVIKHNDLPESLKG